MKALKCACAPRVNNVACPHSGASSVVRENSPEGKGGNLSHLSVQWLLQPEHRGKLCLRWQGQNYEFKTLPLWLGIGPKSLNETPTPVVGRLQARGIRIVIYLDDILIDPRMAWETTWHKQPSCSPNWVLQSMQISLYSTPPSHWSSWASW